MTEPTEYIARYMLHDPVGNVEGVLANFDPAELAAAESSGMVIIAEYNTGRREVVRAADVREPEPRANGIKLVAPGYVDKRMRATLDVFDALAADVGGGIGLSAVERPKTFEQALGELRALVESGE